MASSLAAQLAQIHTQSTNSLNLKAQRAAHAKSLIFDPRVAVSQDFETLYEICHEGFQELCALDGRFTEFQRTLFSEQSKEQDRTQMTAAENAELDKRIEIFLGLVGARLRLSPAIKAVEWLVRRFGIHEHNTSFLLTTFLSYHTLPIFTTLLSIIPERLPQQYHFLHPYIRSLQPPTRHSIVYTATNDTNFAALLNGYVLKICNNRQQYPALITFWTGVMSEAVCGMLDKARSGRQEVQAQNEQDVILRLLPTLNDGLAMRKVPELRIGCYLILIIMATKGSLEDRLLTAMMESVVLGWSEETFKAGLVCLSQLAQQRGAKQLTKRLTKSLLRVEGLDKLLVDISKDRRVDKLANGLCLSLVERLRKHGDTSVLPLIEHIVGQELLTDAQSTVVLKSLLLVALRYDENDDTEGQTRSALARSLTTLVMSPDRISLVMQKAISDSDIDMDELEMKLRITIRSKALPSKETEDTEMAEAEHPKEIKSRRFEAMMSELPDTTDEVSFLSHNKSQIYNQLLETFLVSIDEQQKIDTFIETPVLRQDLCLDQALYFSFFIRTWCGQSPVLARTAALRVVTQELSHYSPCSIDPHAMIPYAIFALGDPSAKVRKAASELIQTLDHQFSGELAAESLTKTGARPQMDKWPKDSIYGDSSETKATPSLTGDHARKLLHDVLSAALEECILDQNHIDSVIGRALNSSKEHPHAASTAVATKLSQSMRIDVLTFLCSHVVNTPLFSAKFRLLKLLNEVQGVASITRTKLLLPVLQHWADLQHDDARERTFSEGVNSTEFDQAVVNIVVANDIEGIDALGNILKAERASERRSLAAAAFLRFKTTWPSLKPEVQAKVAQLLLDIGQPDEESVTDEEIKGEALDVLRSVTLSSTILLSFLHQLPTAAKLADKPPATKRRRVSHGEVARTNLQDSKELIAAIQKTTFVLQLIDSSSPQKHPLLLKGLFNALAELQHFKSHVGSELAYLQGLVLSSLLAIVNAYRKDASLKIDRSAIRTDLLVDCVQKTTSPQVQNAALLLIASLAVTASELVLHSVMPIFTFMGSSILRQNDDYSAHVIKQTITEVIPPLITSLRKKKGNPVTGAAELLLSFVAAYEHVPAHRRKGLFVSLVTTLGPEDFLFALLAMLVNKYGVTENIKMSAIEISGSFSVEVQLHTALKYIELVLDVLKPKRTISNVLLGSADSEAMDPHRTAVALLTFLPLILSQPRLIEHTGKLLEQDDMDAARIRELYSSLLEHLLELADNTKDDKQLQSVCGDVLQSLLGLLHTSEFVKSVESLLDRPNDALRRKVLRSVELRVDQESQSDKASRQAFLNFVPQVTAIIRESGDDLYKQIAVSCVDKIAAKYGKKDIEAVTAAAETIASEHCLGQEDGRLRVMALLCLASLTEILREGIVSVLPVAIPKALGYLEKSIEEENSDEALHNAAYSFMTALVQHLPYMVTGSYLDSLLVISNKSAEADLDEDADEYRLECLKFAAKQIDAKVMFTALENNWKHAAEAGILALREFLEVLSIAIDKHPKSVITKQSSILSNIFVSAFDLRRSWFTDPDEDNSYDSDDIVEIERLVNNVGIKMIYKFNDTTFRPIFARLVEWAVSALPKKDKRGRVLRLESIYSFMAVFFSSLKSIVTSYATYLLDPSVEILKSVDVEDEDGKELWSRVLSTLTEAFKHDQDDFWQSPAHFEAILPALEEQFLHASSLPIVEQLVPAIVELATVADSADHHKDLNGRLMKLLRSESSSIRLAAVYCEQALTDRLGEEWLSLLPEMLPFISELQEDDDDVVERETHRWIVKIESVLGESLDSMLQ